MTITGHSRSWRERAKKCFLFLFVCALMVALFEGFTSLLLFVFYFRAHKTILAETVHTRFDRELGWVSIPNFYSKNMYGSGVYLKTNSKGFRNNEEIEPKIPAGKSRIICSGDSFTLGYGVDNDHTWCQLLASLDPRIQTVNMGQGGYGVDQAYLWYLRDGKVLDHDAQIFAIMKDDLRRMQLPKFGGYGKPLLTLCSGQLTVTNVPVPKYPAFMPWIAQNGWLFKELRTVRVMESIANRVVPRPEPAANSNNIAQAPAQIVAKILESLQATNRQKASILIVVFLPTKSDASEAERSQQLRDFLEQETKRQHIPFFDLTDEFSSVRAMDVDKLFISQRIEDYTHAMGHYTAQGNELVAQALYRRLMTLPELAEKLSDRSSPSSRTPRAGTH
jgi:hypothetical protein